MSQLTHGPIVGATTADSVIIWLRAIDVERVEVRLAEKAADLPDTYVHSSEKVWTEEDDGTGSFHFNGLAPDQTYAYTVLVDGTAVLPTAQFPVPQFRTFPESGQNLSFAFGSCFIPQDHTDEIFERIGEQVVTAVGAEQNLRFFVMLGDNVYVDHYYETEFSGEVDDCDPTPLYREAYRKSWEYERFRRTLMNVPTYMAFDDHEFWNNWGNIKDFPQDEAPYTEAYLKAALKTYREYQDQHNPGYDERLAACESGERPEPPYYYDFAFGDIGFFALDCRTERDLSENGRKLISEEQLQALLSWLTTNKERYRVKFVISSVPITFIALPPLLVELTHETLGDQWLGYPNQRAEIFQCIQEYDIQNVHFLSGDIHLGQGVRIASQLDQEHPTVYSYTASPLAQSTSILSVDAPAASSAVVGGIVGLGMGAALFRRTWAGVILAVGLGAGIGELVRRLYHSRLTTDSGEPGPVGKGLYEGLRRLVQFLYRLGVHKVAGDDIEAENMHYRPESLFDHTTCINYGVVDVRQSGDDVTVQFTLYDREGNVLQQEQPPHQAG